MSWHFLQEQEEASWEGNSLDGAPSALLRLMPMPGASSLLASETGSLSPSRSGMTSDLSTGEGGEASMFYLEDSPANHSAQQLEGGTSPLIYGPKCCESLESADPAGCSRRMWGTSQSFVPPPIFIDLAMPAHLLNSRLPEWVRRITGAAGGWLATPTKTANHDSPSMQKWPSMRAHTIWTGGRTTPAHWEWLMGWPIGWSALEPLATDRFQRWQHSHSKPYRAA